MGNDQLLEGFGLGGGTNNLDNQIMVLTSKTLIGRALDELHRAGIRTYVMIAPMLPGAENLAEILAGKVNYVMLDRMNYHYADWVYRKYSLEDKMTDDYFSQTERTLSATFAKWGISCQ